MLEQIFKNHQQARVTNAIKVLEENGYIVKKSDYANLNFKKIKNKTESVLNHLLKWGSISSLEAINNYNATRLSAIIFNLIKRGYEIKTEVIPKANGAVNYTLQS